MSSTAVEPQTQDASVEQVATALTTEDGLDPDSYTAKRLQHATPEHINITSRRCFIGPIPQAWLVKHRKAWYKHRPHRISTYASRTATFSAGDDVSYTRRVTGLDGSLLSPGSVYSHSFPQPDDAIEDEGDEEDESGLPESLSRTAPVPISRLENGAAEASRNAAVGSTATPSSLTPKRKSSLKPPKDTLLPRVKATNDGKSMKSAAGETFVTAREEFEEDAEHDKDGNLKSAPRGEASGATIISDQNGSPSTLKPNANRFSDMTSGSTSPLPSPDETPRRVGATDSTSSLIPHNSESQLLHTESYDPSALSVMSSAGGSRKLFTVETNKLAQAAPEEFQDDQGTMVKKFKLRKPNATGLVRFNLPDEASKSNSQLNTSRFSDEITRQRETPFKRSKLPQGMLVKAERMLVRVDVTRLDVPDDYAENESLAIETQVVEKWREFVVVVRKSLANEDEFILQMLKTRVVPAVEDIHIKRKAAHEIVLSKQAAHVNMYSSLDKTIAIWTPYKKGTRIYILRPRSSANAAEWLTFLLGTLGWRRQDQLTVNVPDLNVSLLLDQPFAEVETSKSQAMSVKDDTGTASAQVVVEELAVASRLIRRSMDILKDSPMREVVEAWNDREKMGLAWKRYDRLEWVHGINEEKMYGSIAMYKTHDLELRPKQHYPTNVPEAGTSKVILDEPTPIEGFLVRLTTQRGAARSYYRGVSKRLYFSTHDHFLCFCQPSKAAPPRPPELPKADRGGVPSAAKLVDKIPLIYAVTPFPVTNGKITWLSETTAVEREDANDRAFHESQRRSNLLIESEGYINLSHVVQIRHIHSNALTEDILLSAPAIPISPTNPRTTSQLHKANEARIFELVLKNGLTVRLQAYDATTCNEWVSRLTKLVHYWKLRIAMDMDLLRFVRKTNLERMEVDEAMEAVLGQFSKKWEVRRAIASPLVFHICGLSCCRSITMSGTLYRKKRMHSTFHRCGVILCHGKLLIFEGTVRQNTGKEVPHIYHEKQHVIDLKNTYLYSGLITESDLLYQNQTFDNNHPGHHALPRVYLDDNWTSTDEDTMTCFVIWHGKKKSFFRANVEDAVSGVKSRRLSYVPSLGSAGRSMVFKTRSRAERDHWVMNISMEIERLQGVEDIRVIPE